MSNLKCSFCGKQQKETQALIAGPAVYICDECSDVVADMVSEQRAKKRSNKVSQFDTKKIKKTCNNKKGNILEPYNYIGQFTAPTETHLAKLLVNMLRSYSLKDIRSALTKLNKAKTKAA